jgi:hypothetical protein
LDVAGEIRSTGGTVQAFFEGSSGNGGYFGTRSNHFLQFRTNNADVVRIDSSGNVGIGTTSPSAKIHVNNGEIYVQNTDYGRVMFVRGSTNIWAVGPRNTDDLYIRREGGSANVIFDGGNVGIGTASPDARLTVSGSASDTVAAFTRTGGANCYITMTSGSSSDYTYEMATERTGASTGNFYFGGNHSTTFKWRQGGYAQLMNLDTGGLTVTGAITNTNTTTSTSSYTNNSLAFIAGSAASSATYIASNISASHSGASGANLSGSLIGLRVTAAENWGSTTNAFAIQSQLTNTLNYQTITNGYNFHANSPSVVANSYLTNAYGLYIAQQKVTGVTTGYGVYQANSADINHFNGNVGIGTTNPLDKLEINGSDRAIALTVGGGAGNEYGGRWRVYDTGAGVYTSFDTKNVGSWTNDRLTILSSNGNVGIGTTSPSYRLDVNSTTDTKLLLTGSTNQNAMLFGAAGSANEYYVAAGNNLVTGGDKGFLIYNTTANQPQLFIEQATRNVKVFAGFEVVGALSKGSGSFRIEHPLPEKSATHQLVHSFIEGPQADLIYRGKATLVNGVASVNIDTSATMTEGTFEALCREVQCFTTNESGWTAIRGKVTGNILTIQAQDSTCTDEISWMVIGERQDKHMMDTEWTDENGKVIVEPLKPVKELASDSETTETNS